MAEPVLHDSDRMIQKWGLLAACGVYAAAAVEAFMARGALDQLLNAAGMLSGFAMLGLPVWLPRHLSEGANAGYAYGPLPLLLRIQRVGIVLGCALVVAGVAVGWRGSPEPLHRGLALIMVALALGVARGAWRARRILALPPGR